MSPDAVAGKAEEAWLATQVPQRVSQPGRPDLVYGCPHPLAWQTNTGCVACGADRATVTAGLDGER